MASYRTVGSGSDGQYQTAVAFPDLRERAAPSGGELRGTTSAAATPRDAGVGESPRYPVTATEETTQSEIGECSDSVMTEITKADKVLADAPSLSSLVTNLEQNEYVQSVGSRSVSTAQPVLDSFDSGSLTADAAKTEEAGLNLSHLVQAKLAKNISNVSACKESDEKLSIPVSQSDMNFSLQRNSFSMTGRGVTAETDDEEPPSSYVQMTANSNIDQRLKELKSVDSSTQSCSLINNNLDLSGVNRGQADGAVPCGLPKNIPGSKSTTSLNLDQSLTSRKTINKETQTGCALQPDEESFGGAAGASTSTSAQTMSSASMSSLPTDDTLVRKLKRKVVLWLQSKLEVPIGKGWQDLAELHEWDYERIEDFENAQGSKGPFRSLLTEPEFQMYKLSDLRKDLSMMPRKDILYDLDEKIRNCYDGGR